MKKMGDVKKMREEIFEVIHKHVPVIYTEDEVELSDAILAKIVERLPKEKGINCCDLNITDDGYRKQGWNDCLTALKHLLSEDEK